MTTAESARQRLRLEAVHHDAQRDGRCALRVRLEWRGTSHTGRADGMETPQGRLRAAARATLNAVEMALEGRVACELVGIKAVRAFDAWVVVASIRADVPGASYRLLGSTACDREEELARSAARSVLDAMNRILERHVGR